MGRGFESELFTRERTATPSYRDLMLFRVFWSESQAKLILDMNHLNLLSFDCAQVYRHFQDDFVILDFALLCNLSVWRSWESYFKKQKQTLMMKIERRKVNAHNQCILEVSCSLLWYCHGQSAFDQTLLLVCRSLPSKHQLIELYCMN